MAKDGQRIDPSSIRLLAGGNEYRIGMRVMTDRGRGTITGFHPNEYFDIGVTLDGSEEELYTTAQNTEPLES